MRQWVLGGAGRTLIFGALALLGRYACSVMRLRPADFQVLSARLLSFSPPKVAPPGRSAYAPLRKLQYWSWVLDRRGAVFPVGDIPARS